MFNEVILTIKSLCPTEDVESLLEAFRPIIEMVIPSPEIHVTVLDEDIPEPKHELAQAYPSDSVLDPRD